MVSFHADCVISTFLACLVLHIIDVPTFLLLLILNVFLRLFQYTLSLSNEEEIPRMVRSDGNATNHVFFLQTLLPFILHNIYYERYGFILFWNTSLI
jgi:hypothetical protein